MGIVSTKGEACMLYDMLDPNRHCDITIVERTAWHIRFGKWGLFFIILFFILQKRDFTLHFHKDTTSITQQKSLTSVHKLLHQWSSDVPPNPNQQWFNFILTPYAQAQPRSHSNLHSKNPKSPTSISTPKATKISALLKLQVLHKNKMQ